MEGILPMVAFLLLLRLLVIIYAAIPDSEYFLQMPLLIAFGFVLILIGQAEFVAHHDNKTRRQLTARIIGTFLRGAAILMGYGLVYYTDGRFFGGQHKPLATAVIVLGGSVLQIMSGGLAHSGWNAFWRWRRKEQYLLNQGRKESNVPAGQAASDVDRRTEKAA
jgi:hypothetical protein